MGETVESSRPRRKLKIEKHFLIDRVRSKWENQRLSLKVFSGVKRAVAAERRKSTTQFSKKTGGFKKTTAVAVDSEVSSHVAACLSQLRGGVVWVDINELEAHDTALALPTCFFPRTIPTACHSQGRIGRWTIYLMRNPSIFPRDEK